MAGGGYRDLQTDRQNEKIYVQVTQEISSEKTEKREYDRLLEIHDNYSKYVLTTDEFAGGNYEGIKTMHIADFLHKNARLVNPAGVIIIVKEKKEKNMNEYRIMIIEDDLTIQTQLKTLLSGNGYEAAAVTDFVRAAEQVRLFLPHLVLLDIRLPGISGFDICSQIRAFSAMPVIFVTSSNTDMDELNSIMLGGDAFITKPYNTAILLAKIAALLRRTYHLKQEEVLAWKGAALHLENSSIEYSGQKAELTKNELKILYYLFKNAGKICARNDIVDFLWDSQLYIDDNALSVNMTRIRGKLEAIGLTDFIRTKHRQGYTL